MTRPWLLTDLHLVPILIVTPTPSLLEVIDGRNVATFLFSPPLTEPCVGTLEYRFHLQRGQGEMIAVGGVEFVKYLRKTFPPGGHTDLELAYRAGMARESLARIGLFSP